MFAFVQFLLQRKMESKNLIMYLHPRCIYMNVLYYGCLFQLRAGWSNICRAVAKLHEISTYYVYLATSQKF